MKLLLVLLLAALASAKLRKAQEPIPGRYIIKMKTGENVDAMISALGNPQILQKYKIVFPGFAAFLTDRMLQFALASNRVEYVEEDGVARADAYVASWGLDRIDQISLPLDNVYQPIGNQGDGVTIYVIDTGINLSHQDFGGRASFGFDYQAGGTGIDCNGHGSHCAGTVAGTDYGVAKAGHVVAVRVLDCAGSGSWADIIAGCEWVATNAVHPAAASMSLGGGVSDSVDDAIRAMINAGVSVSVSGGNDNFSACRKSPARTLEAITVGATDRADVRASFSNYGSCLDIFGPGVSITSAWIGSDTAINTISGTSMSTPHVAGAAAILLGDEPTMSPADVKATLQLKSIAGAVGDPQEGSPNLLLYMGEGYGGGGYIPDPEPYDDGCGGNFSDISGSFRSQHYPSEYGRRITCDYLVWNPAMATVTVEMDDFNLEGGLNCTNDKLAIYDGSDTSATLIGEYCDTIGPGIVVSNGSSLFLRMTTDFIIQKTGFHANYFLEGETGGCGTTFTSHAGFIYSPNYPEKYANNEDCSFTIQGEVGKTVTLTFRDFEIEQHTSCDYDSLEVYDGTDDMGNRLANLCGEDIPTPVTSTTGSGLFLRFRSDGSVSRMGFSSVFSVQ